MSAAADAPPSRDAVQWAREREARADHEARRLRALASPSPALVAEACAVVLALAATSALRLDPRTDALVCVYCLAPADRRAGRRADVAFTYRARHTTSCLWDRARRWTTGRAPRGVTP